MPVTSQIRGHGVENKANTGN